MPRLLVLTLAASTLLACDSGRKLGIAGANCQKSADCEDWLQCVAGVCADGRTLAKPPPVDPARPVSADYAARAAQPVAADPALAGKDLSAECVAAMARQDARLEALTAELRALQAEQQKLAAEKQALDDRLASLLADTNKAALEAEKAALDAQLGKPRVKPVKKSEPGPKTDPLAGIDGK